MSTNSYITYEFIFDCDVISPGTNIVFRRDYGVYQFRQLTHLDGETRVEYYCPRTDGIYSRPIKLLRGVFKRKKSRRHKPNER